MFGIRVVLVVALLTLLAWFLRSRNATSVRAIKKVLLFALIGFAVLAVLNPESTNLLASFLGVGRGADLLLYALTVSFLFFALNGYLKHLDMEQRIVTLTREIALLERRLDESDEA